MAKADRKKKIEGLGVLLAKMANSPPLEDLEIHANNAESAAETQRQYKQISASLHESKDALQIMPDSAIQQLSVQCQKAAQERDVLKEIKTTMRTSNVGPQEIQRKTRDVLLLIEEAVCRMAELAYPYFAYALTTVADSNAGKLGRAVSRIDKLEKAFSARIKEIGDDAAAKVREVEELLAKGGFHFNSEAFTTEARNQQRWAVGFLAGTVVSAGIIFFYLILGISKDDLPHRGDVNGWVYFAGIRVVIFSLFFTLLSFCMRSYRAHRHLSAVNRHRANALTTYTAFRKGVDHSAEVRTAVLMQACQAVFAPRSTGFGVGTSPAEDSARQIDSLKSLVDVAIKNSGQP